MAAPMTRMPLRRQLQVAVLVAAAVGLAAATQAQDRLAVTVGAGGIFGTDPPPNENFQEPLFIVAIQKVMKRYFVLEGDLSYWAHTSRFERGPHNVNGPSGVIGRVEHSTSIDDYKNWTYGLNFLVRSTGAVRVFGGVGAGLITQEAVYTDEDTGCVGITEPLPCARRVDRRVHGPLPNVRAIGGIEVPVARRVAIVGTVRAEASDLDDRSHTLSGIAGVRFALK